MQTKCVRERGLARSTLQYSACETMARIISFGIAWARAGWPFPPAGCWFGGAVRVVGPALVVEVVQQRGEAPQIFISAGLSRVSAHAGFYRQRVLAQIFVLRVFAEQSPSVISCWPGRHDSLALYECKSENLLLAFALRQQHRAKDRRRRQKAYPNRSFPAASSFQRPIFLSKSS